MINSTISKLRPFVYKPKREKEKPLNRKFNTQLMAGSYLEVIKRNETRQAVTRKDEQRFSLKKKDPNRQHTKEGNKPPLSTERHPTPTVTGRNTLKARGRLQATLEGLQVPWREPGWGRPLWKTGGSLPSAC